MNPATSKLAASRAKGTKRKKTNRDPTGQGQKKKKGPERSPMDPPTARAREILSPAQAKGPLPPPPLGLPGQASERASGLRRRFKRRWGTYRVAGCLCHPFGCAMSHCDSTAANDMSDRHGHKSNLRPFCCGTPAEDVGGREGWSIGNKSCPHFFPFALHVGHASLVRGVAAVGLTDCWVPKDSGGIIKFICLEQKTCFNERAPVTVLPSPSSRVEK